MRIRVIPTQNHDWGKGQVTGNISSATPNRGRLLVAFSRTRCSTNSFAYLVKVPHVYLSEVYKASTVDGKESGSRWFSNLYAFEEAK